MPAGLGLFDGVPTDAYTIIQENPLMASALTPKKEPLANIMWGLDQAKRCLNKNKKK